MARADEVRGRDTPIVARAGRRSWVALAVLVLPVLLISVDMTVLSFAVPHLSQDLQPSGPQLLWIADVYGFMIAGLLVTMGTIGDRIGRRRLLLIGAAAFGAASTLAAYAGSPVVLIVARALLGMAGATLMPSTLSLIRNIFLDARQRTLAIAIWAMMFSVGAALGPVVGGWLLEHFWWGSVFLINLPVMVLLLILAPLLVPESRNPKPGRYDLLSAGLSLMALVSVVYGIKRLAVEGPDVMAIATLLTGAVLGMLFVRRQRWLTEPLLDLRLFGDRALTASVMTNLTITFAWIGTMFFITQYLQNVLDLRPVTAGLVLVPGLVLAVVMGLVAVPLVRRFPPHRLIGAGLLTLASGYLLLILVDVTTGVIIVGTSAVLVNGGIGVIQTVTNDVIMSGTNPDRAGAVAAVSETAYEVGGGMGLAILGSVLTAVYADQLTPVAGVAADDLDRARETLGGADAVADGLGDGVGEALRAAADQAFVTAIHVTSVTAAVVVGLIAMWVTVTLRRVDR